jgi:hypothetical protein
MNTLKINSFYHVYYLPILFFFISPFFSVAGDTLYYAGNIIVSNKLSYTYKLRFVIRPDRTLTGYSLTDSRGIYETKTKISGRYDSVQNVIYYEEHNVLRSKVDTLKNELCFVRATLVFKKNKLTETLSGKFIGVRNGSPAPCGKGEIKLINTQRVKI